MIYSTLFLIGLLGIAAMFLMGFVHIGHAHHAHGSHGPHHTHAGSSHSAQHGSHHAGHHHAHQSPNSTKSNTPKSAGNRGDSRLSSLFWSILSPMTIFSYCFGAGLTGILLKQAHLSSILTALISVCGALGFNHLIVQPLANLIFGFASKPSEALDGAVTQTAKVISHFDENGKGLVQVNVDGQLVRILAILEQEDRDKATVIQPGEDLTITYVDGHTNTCYVTRL